MSRATALPKQKNPLEQYARTNLSPHHESISDFHNGSEVRGTRGCSRNRNGGQKTSLEVSGSGRNDSSTTSLAKPWESKPNAISRYSQDVATHNTNTDMRGQITKKPPILARVSPYDGIEGMVLYPSQVRIGILKRLGRLYSQPVGQRERIKSDQDFEVGFTGAWQSDNDAYVLFSFMTSEAYCDQLKLFQVFLQEWWISRHTGG